MSRYTQNHFAPREETEGEKEMWDPNRGSLRLSIKIGEYRIKQENGYVFVNNERVAVSFARAVEIITNHYEEARK